MNMTPRLVGRRSNRVDFQTAVSEPVVEEVKKTTKVRDTDFGEVHSGSFSITVKSPTEKDEKGNPKVLYSNEKEPFEYDRVIGFPNVLKHAGAKLGESELEFLNQSLSATKDDSGKETPDSVETGKAISSLINIYNSKLKADAKSSRYQTLVNQYTPLEGSQQETAQARMISQAIRLAGISKEAAIEMLKAGKVLPEDYTVADFDSTPLRRTKGESDE